MSDEPVIHRMTKLEKRAPHDWIAVCSCGKACEGTSSVKVSTRLDRHIADLNQIHCPTGKVAYQSRDDAEHDRSAIWRRLRASKMPQRAYRCECGSWHLTSQPKRGSSSLSVPPGGATP